MRHRAIVTEIETLAPSVLQLTVAFKDDFRFDPGQWVNIEFHEGFTRAYTIASAPQRPTAVQLCVRVGEGRGAAAIRTLRVGAELEIEGPFGDHFAAGSEPRTVVFLAGDVGIAPVRSVVLDLLARDDGRKIIVLYEPDQRQVLYRGDFDPLARAGKLVHESGAIETLVARHRETIASADMMAAGFDPFLERTRKAVAQADGNSGAITELSFGPQP